MPAGDRRHRRQCRAIGLMTYAFARIGAVVAMRVEDYFANGKRVPDDLGSRRPIAAVHGARCAQRVWPAAATGPQFAETKPSRIPDAIIGQHDEFGKAEFLLRRNQFRLPAPCK
jgi:hypothetical protein